MVPLHEFDDNVAVVTMALANYRLRRLAMRRKLLDVADTPRRYANRIPT